ncbi:MAG: hypothetical protein OXU68_11925 [Bacteroidota bacterium]|nr:hypothetical protein [Bacteroidota bacterium]
MVFPATQRFALIGLLIALGNISAQAQDRYAVLIGGLGGAPDQTERIGGHLRDTYHALTGPLGFDATRIFVLAEQALQHNSIVDDLSTAENIRAHFATLSGSLGEKDALYVMLFGHGSSDGQRAALNIPRRDLNELDYARLAETLAAGLQIWVCTMSVSGPFMRALSAPGRVVMTATRTATQRNRTVFPDYFAEALRAADADLDQDGSLSVLEVFRYAAEKSAFHYSSRGQLATEHSLLDDTGDGNGVRVEDLPTASDGHLAGITYLRQAHIGISVAADSPLAGVRQELERQIASLRAQKSTMDVDAYYAELETLFVELARLNDRIEATQQ